jgi:hypothetical protein
MFEELSIVEESVKEILIDLMTENLMSMGIKASSTRGVQASSSTTHGSGPSRAATEKRTKHRDDLENVKLLSSILPKYIPPLACVVSHDSFPRDFEYIVITVYLPRGYAQLDHS